MNSINKQSYQKMYSKLIFKQSYACVMRQKPIHPMTKPDKNSRELQTNLTCTYIYQNLTEILANKIQHVKNSRNAKMIQYQAIY